MRTATFFTTAFTLTVLLGIQKMPLLAQSESLLIGPGDSLHVLVFDTPELEQRARVTDSGEIPLMFLGKVKVSELTPSAAAKKIESELQAKQYMLHPQVTVNVEQYATQTVSVLGQVTNPGVYPISTSRTVLDLLSAAGGLTDIADRHITIQRHGDANVKVTYYLSNHADEAFNKNVLVFPGDTVMVPRAGVVYILGDVAKPGGFSIGMNDSKMTLLQALALAGSPNKTAITSKAKLIRKTDTGATQESFLSIAAIQQGKQPDVEMHPDDVLFVPFSYMKNMILNGGSGVVGQVGSASIYAIR